MSIFDDLFGGSDSKQKSSSTTSGTTTKQESADTATAKTEAMQKETSATQQAMQTQQTFTFTPEQMQTLDALINKAAAKETVFGAGTEDLATLSSNVAQFIGTTLQNQPNVDELVTNAKNAAKLDYEENVAPGLTQFAGATGSEANTLVQQLRQKGGSDLATKLFGLESDIRLKAADQEITRGATAQQAILGALQGSQNVDLGGSQALQNTLAALGLAKGGTVSTVGQGLTSQVGSEKSTESSIQETLAKVLTEIKSTQTTKGSGSSSQGGSFNIVDILLSSLGGNYGAPA